MQWIYLSIAIATEVVATSALKQSDGCTRLIPTVVVAIGYIFSFYFLSLALRTLPLGVAYAIWSGVGIAVVSTIGWYVYGQRLDAVALLGLGLIAAGVVVLKLFSGVELQ